MKTIDTPQNEISIPRDQLQILADTAEDSPGFDQKLDDAGWGSLRSGKLDILQVNLGKMCNQTCVHCHVDAGPNRREIMTREILQHCLSAVEHSGISTVDLTGGAPEMNPNFAWFVEQLAARNVKILVRSNLTILTTAERYRRLPAFFARHRVSVISSLPCYTAENTDLQRGEGVFAKSIEALRMLNEQGYGRDGTGLELNLVYNPLGAFLPGPQDVLEADYKRVLGGQFGIVFNRLFCITNMPINRFLDDLMQSGRYREYMQILVDAFNPATIEGLMCRNILSVGWDGALYDCDFNQMLELKCSAVESDHIKDFTLQRLENRRIITGPHCFGCTAGAGSSCAGEII